MSPKFEQGKMNQAVLVRYGELALKSRPVRREFEEKLINNIKSILADTPHKITSERGRIFIDTGEPRQVAKKVSNIPGIVSTSPVYKTEASIEQISKRASEVFWESFPDRGTFAVRPRRTGDHDFSSQDIGEAVGRNIMTKFPDLKVDLDHPDYELFVEVREDKAYVFTAKEEGIGGLPVSTQGEVVSLYSGSLNSIVSTYLMLKRGARPSLLFLRVGEDEEGLTKGLERAKKLLKFHPVLNLFEVPFHRVKKEISDKVPRGLRWILYQRACYSVGEMIAKNVGGEAIISETTLEEMKSYSLGIIRLIEEGITPPIFNPLTGLERKKKADIARDIINGKGKKEERKKSIFQSPLRKKDMKISEIKKAEKRISKQELIESAFERQKIYELEA